MAYLRGVGVSAQGTGSPLSATRAGGTRSERSNSMDNAPPMLAEPASEAAGDGPRGCASASSTTSCTHTGSAARSAGTTALPTSSPSQATRYHRHDAPMGSRGNGAPPVRRGRRRRAADGELSARRQAHHAPALLFGLGVLVHLLRHGRRYDVVHTSSFPYFSLLAAAIARPLRGIPHRGRLAGVLVAHLLAELPGALGAVGWAVQRLCLAVRQHAFCFAELTAERLRANRVNGDVEVLKGLYAGDLSPRRPATADPWWSSRRDLSGEAADARDRGDRPGAGVMPQLTAAHLRAWAEWDKAAQLIADLGLGDVIEMTDFVERPVLEAAMAKALCLLHPSSREGYGLSWSKPPPRAFPASWSLARIMRRLNW